MADGPEWFAPKARGVGSGLPIAWQGWALLIGYIAVLLALTPLAGRSILAHLSAVSALTVIFMIICAKTTRGGWRWRGRE
ncbi:hypothetical protein [Sphingomonas sp. LHG3406-1]|uniref:hypothetical protein n=1 Tax=Sphingomonas sp. LHG3406-1 TaxID=2804617 RepID=UPI002635DF51|nr:hypothetical protein [Sphingomonas sp. LHG3406-1]